MPKDKIRIDDLLIQKGLIVDRKAATALLMSGSVLVNDQVVSKGGELVLLTSNIRIRERIKKYVSRGALKLLGAFDHFSDLNIVGMNCWDWGSSTGGFTEVLLEKGAESVTCVDVGYGQMAQRIANHPKVIVFDRLHLRDFEPEIPTSAEKQVFVTMDLSFVSLAVAFEKIKMLAEMYPSLSLTGLSLFKPQFEVSPQFLTRGVLLDHSKIGPTICHLVRKLRKNDSQFRLVGICESPIQGTDGNREFFLYWKRNS